MSEKRTVIRKATYRVQEVTKKMCYDASCEIEVKLESEELPIETIVIATTVYHTDASGVSESLGKRIEITICELT